MDNSIKQHLLDHRYLRMAQIWAENSYCRRRQVGALLVKDKMIISDGFNGTPSGFDNVCEDETNHTYPYVLHAEANAITKVARSNNSSDALCDRLSMHRVRQADNPSRHQARGLLQALPAQRRTRPFARGRSGMLFYQH